ncbi:hypothetical protein BH11BAC5_BH11BAC5_36970 [soil metagenome]|jgi:hypothetical protein
MVCLGLIMIVVMIISKWSLQYYRVNLIIAIIDTLYATFILLVFPLSFYAHGNTAMICAVIILLTVFLHRLFICSKCK